MDVDNGSVGNEESMDVAQSVHDALVFDSSE
jgi:hypothetical protein